MRLERKKLQAGVTLLAVVLLAACSSTPEASAPAPTAPGAAQPAPSAPADWAPSRTVRFLVPYGAGGGFDAYSRGFAQSLQDGFLPSGVTVFVENNTPVQQGIFVMYSTDPDGHLLGMLPMPAGIAQEVLFPEVSRWETEKFTILGSMEENNYAIYVRADSDIRTVDDLKARSGLKAMTVEKGSSSSIAALGTIAGLGLDATLVFGADTSADTALAMIRGEVDFLVYGATDFTGFVESGDVRPIAFLGGADNRPDVAYLANVPTIREAGYPELENAVTEMRLIVGPPNMPAEVEAYWIAMVERILASDQLKSWSETSNRPLVPRSAASAREAFANQVATIKGNKDALKKLFDE